jgi:hypothetical protein
MQVTIEKKDKATVGELIVNLKKAVQNSPTKVSFVSIKGYKNKFGEISNNLINVGISYQKAKQKDIEFLTNLDINSFDSKLDKALLEQARTELIQSFITPEKNRSEGQINAYTPIIDGVKVHNETGVIYIYGYREKKEILTEGTYPVVNSKPLTIAKNELRKKLSTGKFVNFSIEEITTIRANKQTLEF